METRATNAEEISTFTGRKLDWLKCCNFDRRLQSFDFKVAFVIVQHVNARTGCAMLSDETIADEAGGHSPRSVRRARDRLKAAGWLDWKRTRTANIYVLSWENFERFVDAIMDARDLRQEHRARRRRTASRPWADRTDASALNGSERS
jgi:hypothetical protein